MVYLNSSASLVMFRKTNIEKVMLAIVKSKVRIKFIVILCVLFSSESFSQTFLIKGTVIDQDSKVPMEFASVFLVGTTTGVNTNRDGSFKIETSLLSDSIGVSIVGYNTLKIKLNVASLNNILLEIKQTSKELSLATIVGDADPGATFMKKVIAHKPYNNPDKFKSYSYKSYNRSELDLNNLQRDKLSDSNLKALMLDTYHRLDKGDTIKNKLPVYFSEVLTDNFHSVSPAIENENVIAKKSLGLETDKLLRHLEKFDIKLNVYDNWLPIFDKTFASPLADAGLNYYKYYIDDSTLVNGHWQYKIQFVPKHSHEDTFTGMMWINDSTFSVNRIEMHMSKNANLNFVDNIKIYEDFTLYPNGNGDELVYMPKKYVSEVAFESGLELLGLPVNSNPEALHLSCINTIVYDSVKINSNNPSEVLSHLKKNISESSTKHTDDFWKQHRLDSLSIHEKAIYSMVDTLKENKRFAATTKIIAFGGSGYWDFANKWRIGPYSSFLSFNHIEGLRIRCGVWSLPAINEKWNFNGYLAYGTRDQKFKGGAGIKYLRSTYPWSKTSIYAQSDYDVIINYDDELDRDNLISSFLRKNIPSTRTYIGEVILQQEEQLNRNWINTTNFTYKEFNPVFNFQYHPLDPNTDQPVENAFAHKLPIAEFNTSFRYAHKERTTILNYDLLKLATDYPVFTVNYTYGFEFISSQFSYHKIGLSLSQSIKLPPKSRLYYHISTGKVFGTAPYLLLYVPRGNEFYVSSKYSFNTMTPYEFVADRYVSLQTRLTLGGLLLDEIPLLQRLKWRERFTFNSFWGDMTTTNLKYNEQSNVLTTGNNPFAEAGIGIENIFHVLSIEYIRRLNHLQNNYAQKGGWYAGVTLNF